MKIYNATKYRLTIPISGSQNLTVPGNSVSSNFLGTAYFISSLITSKKPEQVAIIVGGPAEMALCSSIPASAPYVVQTVDEAIQRFLPKEEVKEEPKPVETIIMEPKVNVEIVEEEIKCPVASFAKGNKSTDKLSANIGTVTSAPAPVVISEPTEEPIVITTPEVVMEEVKEVAKPKKPATRKKTVKKDTVEVAEEVKETKKPAAKTTKKRTTTKKS